MRAALERLARRAWTPHTPGDRALRAALVPAALAYGGAAALRNRLYDTGWLTSHRVAARVLSVGNIVVGGTGKTPTVLWLAEHLAARGRRVGIVARGYRKQRRGVVVVGERGEPLVSAEEGGDEAVMLARRFPGPVVTAERRHEAAGMACARFQLDTIVLDDGFQHRALARDADLVLLGDDTRTTWTLPAGPLREPPARLARARALLMVDGAPEAPRGDGHLFRGWLRPTGIVRVEGAGLGAQPAWVEEPLAALAGRPVIAVAGVALPERFARTLTVAGARVQRLLSFPDHHTYDASDAREIAAALREALVVTTEKDLVKLGRFPDLHALRALRVALEVENGEALLDLLTAPAAAGGFVP